MNALGELLQNVPSWVSVQDRQKESAIVLAAPPGVGSAASSGFWLRLEESQHGGIAVSEVQDKRQLPAFCLERHINPDSTFCVFFRSEHPMQAPEGFKAWWSHLGVYLNNQKYASKRGIWPLGSGLSHGEAAHVQVAMEELADPLGWKDDLWQAMFRGKGWLAQRLPRISKRRDRVLNARSPCPRGCTWKHKLLRKGSCHTSVCDQGCGRLHKPILRADCPNRAVIENLVLLENERQRIEARIIDDLRSEGKKCCGTMKRCPLREQ
ncbi:E2 domain-associated cysteine-rich protein [Loktanella sp. M215]|uniref:E2 domain-associated cysteine-rich protein n=1 Tax=Loktanella sp. M215 TaxID=2675431 RepID=UPI001F461132|nr:E2 domain-associated cysteine-rich protein [Loktanella sp. M215]MCF7699923.1 hypothetical protein [Loktanella sp. M215]